MKHLLHIFIINLCCNVATVTAQDDKISFDFIIFVDDHLWTTGATVLFVLRNETIGLVDTVIRISVSDTPTISFFNIFLDPHEP